jgi:hypothetical protein
VRVTVMMTGVLMLCRIAAILNADHAAAETRTVTDR